MKKSTLLPTLETRLTVMNTYDGLDSDFKFSLKNGNSTVMVSIRGKNHFEDVTIDVRIEDAFGNSFTDNHLQGVRGSILICRSVAEAVKATETLLNVQTPEGDSYLRFGKPNVSNDKATQVFLKDSLVDLSEKDTMAVTLPLNDRNSLRFIIKDATSPENESAAEFYVEELTGDEVVERKQFGEMHDAIHCIFADMGFPILEVKGDAV